MATIYDEELLLPYFWMPVYNSLTIKSGVEDMDLLMNRLG